MGLEYVALPYLLFFLDLITSIGLLYPVCATTEGIVIGNAAERYQPLIGRPQHNLPFWLQQMEGFDPQAQIRCKGKVPGGIPPIDLIPPEMQLPPIDFNTPLIRRIYSNARELCAKPAYGGSLVAFNAGGYCAHQSSPPTVLFERLPPGGREMGDGFKRVFLFCQHHCSCVHGNFNELAAQGRPATEILNEERSDIDTDSWEKLPLRANLYQGPPQIGPDYSPYIPVYFLRERLARAIGPGMFRDGSVITIWIAPFSGVATQNPGKRIRDKAPVCTGVMTEDERSQNKLILPYQSLCAADWFGGFPEGNAGLVCRFSPYFRDYLLKSEFSVSHPMYDEEMSDPENMLIERQMSMCLDVCTCESDTESEPPPDSTKVQINVLSDLKDTGWLQSLSASSTSNPRNGDRNDGTYPLFGMLSTFNRDCATNMVSGLDLTGSLARQSACSWGRRRRRKHHRR